MTIPGFYDQLKEIAKRTDRSVTQLLALAPENDPFSVTMPSRREAAEWFAKVIWAQFGEDAGVLHLRRLHYRVISENTFKLLSGVAYTNTQSCWKYLCQASLAARYLKLIPFNAFTDRRNAEPLLFAGDAGDPSEQEPPDAHVIGDDVPTVSVIPPSMPSLPFLWYSSPTPKQKFVCETWIEKSSQNDILEPLCRRRGVNLIVVTGESSETRCRECVERAIEYGVPVRILYISDFDPAGQSMPKAVARKVEFHIRQFADEYNLDIQLIPVALSQQQVVEYRLPRVPVKDSDGRKHRFEETFGTGAVELDALEALHPGTLAKLVNAELDNWLDRTLDRRSTAFKGDLYLLVDRPTTEVHRKHSEEIATLEANFDAIADDVQAAAEAFDEWSEEAAKLWATIAKELDEAAPDLSDVEVPEPEVPEETDNFVLYNSARGYVEQMDFYNQWKDGDTT